jgi:hypothetical protein
MLREPVKLSADNVGSQTYAGRCVLCEVLADRRGQEPEIVSTVLPSGVVRLSVQDVNRHIEAGIAALRRMPYPEYLRSAHWQRVRALAFGSAVQQCELARRSRRSKSITEPMRASDLNGQTI